MKGNDKQVYKKTRKSDFIEVDENAERSGEILNSMCKTLDYTIMSNNLQNKCGEIFVLKKSNLIFMCTLCNIPYENAGKFVNHLKENHFDVYNDSDKENPPESIDQNTNNYAASIINEKQIDNSIVDCSDIPEEKYRREITEEKYQHLENKSTICFEVDDKIKTRNQHNFLEIDDNKDPLEPSDQDISKFNKCETHNEIKLPDSIENVDEKFLDHLNGFVPENCIKTESKKSKRKRRKLDSFIICEICQKSFGSESALKRHQVTCKLEFEHSKNVAKMNLQLNQQKSNSTDDKKDESISTGMIFAEPLYESAHICRYCNDKFKSKMDRIEHECIHTGEYLYKCEICGKSFRRKNFYTRHIDTHKTVKRFKCDVCQMGFSDKTNLTVHLRRHTGEKPYKCGYCDMRFVVSTEKKSHERQHTGEKPFHCNICGNSFVTSSRYNSHLVKHRPEKPFKCEDCGKGLLTAALLKDHVAVYHLNEKYTCDICGVKVVRKSNLRKHMVLHSNVKSYLCALCGKSFHQRTGLCIHMKTHKKLEVSSK